MFSAKKEGILSVFMMAGYPSLEGTVTIVRQLQDCGADMVEIGMPFSDPLADGPVIQECSQVALQNGMSLERLFTQIWEIRKEVTIPLVLMGYLNPVLKFGMERFVEHCSRAGIDGVILPDLPPDEYDLRYRELFDKSGIHHILLISPHTGEDRIRKIARLSGGFLYMVADASTTGAREKLGDHQVEYFRRIQQMDLPVPGLVGFGISNRDAFRKACEFSRGAIIGSAFLKALSGPGPLEKKISDFVNFIKG